MRTYRYRYLPYVLTSLLFSYAYQANAEQPETLLEQAISQVSNQQIDTALNTLNTLIQAYPNFQLAQLMRADLLYAQAHSLTQMGGQLPTELQQSLQAEARARLHAIKHLAQHQQPAYLIGTPPDWLHNIISVDLSASRAYLFQIDKLGILNFVNSFYLTQGKLGAGKTKEGDKRTPIGIYHLQKPIPARQLSGFYGAGALPLDYPNSWDRLNQRTGHGIWLHGTPATQYSRPPQASDGCMVFSNDDMRHLLDTLDWQHTLVITDKQIIWQDGIDTGLNQQLQQRLEQWRLAWQQRQLDPYLAFYADNFTSQAKENKQQWRQRKSTLFAINTPIYLQLGSALILRYPGDDNLILTEFDQRYQRGNNTSLERKRLWWQQQHNQWMIVYEEIIPNS